MEDEIEERLLEIYTKLKHSYILPVTISNDRDAVIQHIVNREHRSTFSVVLRDYTKQHANLTLKEYSSVGGVHIEQFGSAIRLIYIENVPIYGKPVLKIAQRIIRLLEGEELDIRCNADY